MSADCLFCKIATKKIPSKIVYEDEDVFAFEDIGPQAPMHVLIIPRKHLASLAEAGADDQAILGKIQLVAARGRQCFIYTCTCWVGARSIGRPASCWRRAGFASHPRERGTTFGLRPILFLYRSPLTEASA
jgi:hypothetical protein